MEIVLIVAIIMAFMNAIAAADSVDGSAVGTDEGNNVVENDLSNALQASSDSDVLGANTWYVKAGATGGDGSEDKPYANLKSVTNNANYKENDVIYVMDGTYKGSQNRAISNLKENTTVMAYEGANPIFDAQKYASTFVITKGGITLKGLTFINGGGIEINIGWVGGAIFNTADNLTVDSCTIKDGDPIGYGTGLFSTGKNTIVKNSNFEGNDATNGGAICIYGRDAKIIGNSFTENQARFGGAIYVAPTVDARGAIIANNNFNKNRANQGDSAKTQAGGSIYMGSVLSTIVNNTFTNGRSGDYGAAISVSGNLNVIDNCTFTDNQIFDMNSDWNLGGAIYIQGDDTTVKNSKFTGNSVRDNGGAILVKASNVKLENCTFDKNWAGRGGAIYIDDHNSWGVISNFSVNNCTFNENGMVTEQDGEPNLGTKGGAIYSLGVDTHVTNSKFNNNVAMTGGAILYERGHNYLENNTFTGNKALRYGGGAISSARFGDTINNCTFEDNFATGYGGAVSADYPKITNSKFIGNEANHGGAICTITADISDSEFRDNVADDNYAILAATKVTESNNVRPGQEAISMNHTTYLEMEYDQDIEIAIMPGYYAYCMEEYSDYPQYGVLWENLRFAQNSISEGNIGEYLKILIFKYWNDESQHANLQKLVNAFTDRNFKENENPIVKDIISLYDSGYRVPTENALRFYENGTVAVFNFKEILTPSSTQNVFAFNITYNPNSTVKKEVITKDIYLNNDVDFNITVTNTGECNLTNLWINDTDFSEGLVYKSFKSPYNWTYDSESKLWILNDTLAPEKSAYIILTFKVTKAGNLTNNVTTGLGNHTFGNDTVNITVYTPNMTVEKISNNKTVKVGEMTSFTIIVKNTGDCNLTGVYVIDNGAEGLKYDHFVDESGKWSFDGNNKWTYNDVLGIDQAANFIIVFKALSEGIKVNTAIAGNNITNDTVNSTNTTNVTVEHNNETVPENETPEKPVNETPSNSTQPQKEVKIAVGNATGNPLMALLAVLLLAGVTSLRKFKK